MLQIEYVKVADLKPYANNAKLHPAEQVEQIKKSIEEFGFNDPVAVWKENEIIEGHGRLIAAVELGLDEIAVIRLDELTDEQRKAYALVHNKLTMNSPFDFSILNEELEAVGEIDMEQFGFTDFDFSYLDEIDGYGESKNNTEKEQFAVTFTFDKKDEDAILGYINENGKDEIVNMIVSFVGGV